jgi:serine/threonine protein kinase
MSARLGEFTLLEQIGKGGMGTVFAGKDLGLNRKVAIKVLNEDFVSDPAFIEAFLTEAQHAAAVNHPNIVQIYSVGQEYENYFIVMEFLEGETLCDRLAREKVISEETVLGIGIQVVQALSAAYQHQLIHGDIKPENIFVTQNGNCKLLDFGLSKLANVEVKSSERVWGSPYYLSPERVGRRAEDFRSDVYSLGATLFEALTGRPPFTDGTIEELALKRFHEKPPLLGELNPSISERTEAIIDQMLQKNPVLRYLSYETLLQDLQAALRLVEKDQARAKSKIISKNEKKWIHLNSKWLIGSALLIAVLGLASVFILKSKNLLPSWIGFGFKSSIYLKMQDPTNWRLLKGSYGKIQVSKELSPSSTQGLEFYFEFKATDDVSVSDFPVSNSITLTHRPAKISGWIKSRIKDEAVRLMFRDKNKELISVKLWDPEISQTDWQYEREFVIWDNKNESRAPVYPLTLSSIRIKRKGLQKDQSGSIVICDLEFSDK